MYDLYKWAFLETDIGGVIVAFFALQGAIFAMGKAMQWMAQSNKRMAKTTEVLAVTQQDSVQRERENDSLHTGLTAQALDLLAQTMRYVKANTDSLTAHTRSMENQTQANREWFSAQERVTGETLSELKSQHPLLESLPKAIKDTEAAIIAHDTTNTEKVMGQIHQVEQSIDVVRLLLVEAVSQLGQIEKQLTSHVLPANVAGTEGGESKEQIAGEPAEKKEEVHA
jgi:hypothetical protein